MTWRIFKFLCVRRLKYEWMDDDDNDWYLDRRLWNDKSRGRTIFSYQLNEFIIFFIIFFFAHLLRQVNEIARMCWIILFVTYKNSFLCGWKLKGDLEKILIEFSTFYNASRLLSDFLLILFHGFVNDARKISATCLWHCFDRKWGIRKEYHIKFMNLKDRLDFNVLLFCAKNFSFYNDLLIKISLRQLFA